MYKGNRLTKYKWEGGSNFEELVTWGVLPAMSFVDVLDDIADNRDFSDNSTACYIVNELKCKLEDIKATIYRFMDEKHDEEKQEKVEPTVTEGFVLSRLTDMEPGVQGLVKDFLDWVIKNQKNGEKVNLVDLHSALKQFSYDAPERLRKDIGNEVKLVNTIMKNFHNQMLELAEKIAHRKKPLNRTRPIRIAQGLSKEIKKMLTATFYILYDELSRIFSFNILTHGWLRLPVGKYKMKGGENSE